MVLSSSVTRSPQIAPHPLEIREREYVKREKRSERERNVMSETRGFLEGPILSAWIQRGERVDAFEKPPSGYEHELCSSFLMLSFVKARARSVRMCRTTEMNYRERPFEHTHLCPAQTHASSALRLQPQGRGPLSSTPLGTTERD